MRDRAQLVIVGAGIVGTSAAYHLAELGLTDVLVLDQGPLFETGGSSSHAPGLVFQTNGSRTMCRIAQDTVAAVRSLELDGEPGWYGVGGIEVATTSDRMRELKRRQGFARSFGVEDTALLSAAETAERIPLLDPSAILGAYLVPTDGIAKAVRIAEALSRRASEKGVAFEGGVTVTGFDSTGGRVRAVETDRGRVECEQVLICAGIWGPTVGAMAGVPIPLIAVQHQLVWTDPIPELAGETREVAHPILRHQDHAMYFRHREDHYGVGNYHHEPIATPQSAIRRPGGAMQPSLMPFTPEDFVSAEAETERLLPALAGRMHPADPSRSINGMFSFTPDAGSIVGESTTTRGRLGVRGGLGDPRGRDGAAGRGVDRERRAGLRPGRGRREPLLPVPDDPAVRARAREAAVPRGVRHPASASADGASPEPPPHAVPPPAPRARRRARRRRRVGASAVVRGEPSAADRRAVGVARRLGRAALVADRRAPSISRRANGSRCSTSRRTRSSTWRGPTPLRSSSGSARTGSTGRSAPSSTRRC